MRIALGLAVLLAAPGAFATTGGPSHLEWVRWDAADGSLWWLVRDGGECDPCTGRVYRQSVSASGAAERVRLRSREVAALRGRTVRLHPRWPSRLARAALTRGIVQNGREVFRDPAGDRRIHFFLTVTVQDGPRSGTVDIVSLAPRRVRIVGLADVPDRSERIAVLRFVGIPVETEYDDETILVLR